MQQMVYFIQFKNTIKITITLFAKSEDIRI